MATRGTIAPFRSAARCHDPAAMLSASQIDVLRESWRELEPRAMAFVDALYEEFFAAEPQLRILFEGHMDEQHRKLASFITFVMDHLDDDRTLRRVLLELGVRHAHHGVQPHHFVSLGTAWSHALEGVWGERMRPDAQAAWAVLYERMSFTMQEGAGILPAGR
jgi:hemoglobin-like flavoprotein